MSEEIAVLKGLMSKDRFLQYSPVLFKIKELEPEIKSLLKAISDYYVQYPDKRKISIDELMMFYAGKYPSSKDKEIIKETFLRIKNTKVENDDLLKDMVDLIVEKYAVNKIVGLGMKMLNGDEGSVIERIKDHIAEYDQISKKVGTSEVEFCDMTLEEMLKRRNEGGLNWRIPSLQNIIGPIVPGTLMHVFARKETGKTAFGISEATHFATQIRDTGKIILYLGNEEPVYRSKMRAICCMFNVNFIYMSQHQEEMWKLWLEHGEPYLKFADSINKMEDVERYLMNTNPAAVFIDQGPKVAIRGDHPKQQELQMIYYQYRQYTVKYNTPIIAFGQADAASENKQWLSITNFDSAKTGMPGELDVALGIGKKIDDLGKENVRYLNVCANKLGGKLGRATTYLKSSGRYADIGR